MSVQLSPDEALQMIPEFAAGHWHWRKMQGGLTNRNYKVDYAGNSFVLRLDDQHTASFGLDRATDLKARKLAAEAGIAASVVFADSGRGILLSEYLAGDVWRKEDLNNPRNLELIAELLHKVHSLPLLGVRLNPKLVAKRYLAALVNSPDLQAFGMQCQKQVAAMPVGSIVCCCHNDVIAENIVAGGDNLMLIDWEYSGDNEPMFDFACLIAFHELDTKTVAILLDAYAGGADDVLRERLAVQIILYDAIQWLWFAARQSVNPDARQAKHLQELRQRIECRIRKRE